MKLLSLPPHYLRFSFLCLTIGCHIVYMPQNYINLSFIAIFSIFRPSIFEFVSVVIDTIVCFVMTTKEGYVNIILGLVNF